MPKIKIKKPDKTLFSDSRLHPIFDKRILRKIIQFNELFDRYDVKLYELKQTERHYNFFYKKETKQIVEGLEKEIKFYNHDKNSKYFNIDLWNITKKNHICEVCSAKRKSFDKAHILKKSAYKNNHLKPKRAFEDYIDGAANIMLVCNNCHSDIDKHHMSTNKINKIIKRRKTVNRRIIKRIQRDIDCMKNVLKDLNAFEREMNGVFNKHMKKILQRYTDFNSVKTKILLES